MAGFFGGKKNKQKKKDRNPEQENIAPSVAVGIEDANGESGDGGELVHHEIKHKRHVIEEVIIEDSDKFYEKIHPKRVKKSDKKETTPQPAANMDTDTDERGKNKGEGGLNPFESQVKSSSSPNITTDSITFVVEHDPSESGTLKKPKGDQKDKLSVGSGEGKTKKKPQEEIVVAGGDSHVEMPGKKWRPFGKKSPSKSESAENISFVIKEEPEVKSEAKPKVDNQSGETLTFVVETEQPTLGSKKGKSGSIPLIGKLFDKDSKSSRKQGEIVLEGSHPQDNSGWHFPGKPKKKKGHVDDDTAPETMTFVVNEPEAKMEVDSGTGPRKWKPFGKGKDKVSVEGSENVDESLTFVVEDNSPKAEIDEGSTVKKSPQGEIVVDDAHMYTDDSKFKLKKMNLFGKKPVTPDDASPESVTFVVNDDRPASSLASDDDKDKDKSWHLFKKAKPEEEHELKSEPESLTFVVESELEKKEPGKVKGKEWHLFGKPKTGEKTSPEGHQEEMVVDDSHLYQDDANIKFKPFGKKVPEAKSGIKAEVGGDETFTFVVNDDVPTEHKVEGKEPWKMDIFGKKKTKPKKDGETEDRKETVPETMTFVVNDDLPRPPSVEASNDDDARFWKFNNPFREKSSTEKEDTDGKAEPESMTFVVEGDLPEVDGETHHKEDDGKKWKPKFFDKKPSEGKSHQGEVVLNETHLYTDDSSLKRKKKPSPHGEVSVEPSTLTFVVEEETPEQKEADGDKDKSWSLFGKTKLEEKSEHVEKEIEKPESVTFVVRDETPPEVHEVNGSSDAKSKSWNFGSLGRPKIKIFGKDKNKHDQDSTGSSQPDLDKEKKNETLTFVVENEEVVSKEDHKKPGFSLFRRKSDRSNGAGSVTITAQEEHDGTDDNLGIKPAPDTVVYTVTTEEPTVNPSKKIEHKWNILGNRASIEALPTDGSSGDAEGTPKRQKQEEIVAGKNDVVTEKQVGMKFPFFGKKSHHKQADANVSVEVPAEKGKEAETITFTVESPEGNVPKPKVTDSLDRKVKEPKWKLFNRRSGEYDMVPKGSDQAAIELINKRPKQEEVIIDDTHLHTDVQDSTWPIRHKKDKKSNADLTVATLERSTDHVQLEKIVSRTPKKIRLEGGTDVKADTDVVKAKPETITHQVITPEVKINGFPEDQGRRPEDDHGWSLAGKSPQQPQTSFETSTPKKPNNDFKETIDFAHELKDGPSLDVTAASGDGSNASQYFLAQPPQWSANFDSSATSGPAPPPLHFVVIAIDFGTTFSGYAFSFARDIESIHVMRKWEGGDPGVVNQKTPTTLLLTPEGDFHSFGFSARDFYHDLTPKEAKRWMYFEKFKMALHYNAVSSFLNSNSHRYC